MNKRDKKKPQKLVAIFVIFLILFNFPVLSIFNEKELIAGIPKLYLAVFVLWIIFIGITAFLMSDSSAPKKHDR